jgi:hypothetical protein
MKVANEQTLSTSGLMRLLLDKCLKTTENLKILSLMSDSKNQLSSYALNTFRLNHLSIDKFIEPLTILVDQKNNFFNEENIGLPVSSIICNNCW